MRDVQHCTEPAKVALHTDIADQPDRSGPITRVHDQILADHSPVSSHWGPRQRPTDRTPEAATGATTEARARKETFGARVQPKNRDLPPRFQAATKPRDRNQTARIRGQSGLMHSQSAAAYIVAVMIARDRRSRAWPPHQMRNDEPPSSDQIQLKPCVQRTSVKGWTL